MALLDVLRDRAELPSQPAETSRPVGGHWPRRTFGFTSLAGRVAERVQQTAQQTPKWGALAGSEGDGDFLFCPTVPRLTPSEKHERRQYAATIREACEKLPSNVDEADALLAASPKALRGWEWRTWQTAAD